VYVRDKQGLIELMEAIGGSGYLAVDTEFMRERTYYARLCLIQIATDDVTAIIDPFACTELEPLFTVLQDPGVVKVLHSAQQDLEIFFQLMGEAVRPVFDTQVAATLAGFPQQVGYGAIVKDLLGVELDKSDTYTDWAKRPLSDTQIVYAMNDVRYLGTVYHALRERLEVAGRLPWLQDDFDRLGDPASYIVEPEAQWRRLKRISSLNRRQLGVLQKVTAWRELEAQRRDAPRRWVLGDESLVEIARRAPASREELAGVRGVGDKLARSAYDGVIEAVKRGVELAEDELPRFERGRRRAVDIEGAVDLMAAIVRLRAKEHDVAVPLLASRGDLERLASGEREDSPLLEGWRKTLIGDELVDLLDGNVTLSLAGGSLTVRSMCEE
jgi:ribonuclease D